MKHTTLFLAKTAFTGILLCTLVFLSLNCIEKPLAPVLAASTVSIGSIPLVDVTEYFSEYEQKSAPNFLVVNGTVGMYDYVNTQSTAKQSITLPTMVATDTSMQVQVGSFSVGSISSSVSVAASDINSSLSGSIPLLLPVSFTITSQPLGDSTTLRYVQLSETASNTLSLTIANNLPIPIAFTQPILFRNNWPSPLDTSWVASFSIPDTLAFGASKTYTTSIAGKRMWGLLQTDPIQIYTPGGTSLSFNSTSNLALTLTSGPLTADSAAAFIPSLTVYNKNNADWVIDDSTILSSAAFDAGAFNLQFVNNLGVDVGVNLTVNELINTLTGKSYSIDTILPTKTTTTLPMINMSQYHVSGGNEINGTSYGTKLTYSGTVKTLSSTTNDKQTVRKSDYISAAIIPDAPFVIKSLTGRIRTTILNIDQRFASNINVNQLKGFSGSIALDSISLLASLPLGGNDGCTADYVIKITEKNTKHNRIDTLLISSYSGSPRIIPGIATQIQIQSVNDTAFFNSLMRFFPDVPDSFYVQGYIVIDPNFTSPAATNSTMHDTSGVYPSFNINLPVRFQIGNSSYTQTMAFDSSQIPTNFTKNVVNGSAVFTVINNMPLQMSMKTAFLHYNPATQKCDTLFWLPKTDTISNAVDSMYILPAPVTSAGWANGTMKTTSTVTLNSSDMANFNKTDSIYIRLYNLQTTRGQTVRVLGTNYIRIVGIANLTYTIKSN